MKLHKHATDTQCQNNKDTVLQLFTRWAYLPRPSHILEKIIFGYHGTVPRRDRSSVDEAFTPSPREQAQISMVWVVQSCSQVLSTCWIYVPLLCLLYWLLYCQARLVSVVIRFTSGHSGSLISRLDTHNGPENAPLRRRHFETQRAWPARVSLATILVLANAPC